MKKLGLALLILSACAHRQPTAENSEGRISERALGDRPYEERLPILEELGRATPGYLEESSQPSAPRGLGLWAGTWLQTEWQMRSGRNRYLHWRLPNATLNLEPSLYLRERRAGLTCPESALAAGPAQVARCDAWNAYFAAIERKARRGTLRARFWRAHSGALERAVENYADELESEKLPPEELAFWSNWFHLVLWMEMGAFPTTDLYAEPILRSRMPNCSPLGAPECRVEDLPPEQRRFVELMIRLDLPTPAEFRSAVGF